jgi:hypothetical protein
MLYCFFAAVLKTTQCEDYLLNGFDDFIHPFKTWVCVFKFWAWILLLAYLDIILAVLFPISLLNAQNVKQLHFLLGCEEVSTVQSLATYLQHSATGVDEDGQHNL